MNNAFKRAKSTMARADEQERQMKFDKYRARRNTYKPSAQCSNNERSRLWYEAHKIAKNFHDGKF